MLIYLKMIEVSVVNHSILVRRCNTDLHFNYITRMCTLFIIFTIIFTNVCNHFRLVLPLVFV